MTPARSIEQPYGWLVVATSFLVVMTAMGAPFVGVVALTTIATEFSWPRAVAAVCYSLAWIGGGIGGLVIGFWSDRVGIGPPLLLAATAILAGGWLAAGSQGVAAIYAAHALIGFCGVGAVLAPTYANASRWFERRRGLAISLIAGGETLAGAVWPPVLRMLVESVGWRQTFQIYAVIAATTIALMVPVLWRRPPQSPGGRASPGFAAPPVLGLPANAVQALLAVAILCCCIPMAMPQAHIVAHATDLGHPLARGAELLAVTLTFGFVSRILNGFLVDRIGGLRTLMIGSLGQGIALLVYAGAESLTGLYLSAALFGLLFGGIVPCYPIIVRELFPAGQAGWRMGTSLLFGTTGMATGAWLAGHIFDLLGSYRPAFLVGVGFNAANLAVIGFLVARQGQWRRPAPVAVSLAEGE